MGAGYRAGRRTIIGGMERAGITANTTAYINPWGGDDYGAVASVEAPFAVPGIIDHLYYQTSNAPGVGETYTITLMLNGAPTALTCQIAGAVQVAEQDLVNVVAIAAGDLVCIRIVTSLNAVVVNHKWTVRFRPT